MKEQEIRKALAAKLHDFRIMAGLTAREVGEMIGKSDKTVSGWEHGRGQPDADMLFRLCEIYGINSIAEFYSEPPKYELSVPLTEQESELLSLFRSLNHDAQTTLLNTARAFAGNPDMQKEDGASITA
ncbi:MAG: helix-turn-helix domain-containing protein [Clostridiales bacterium]|nr:helix-turn-helix domain-containing protein [Clostridiales bacterium]